MENAFRRLEGQVPAPQWQPWNDGFVLRHKEQMIEQALIQKLARVVSGLHAIVDVTRFCRHKSTSSSKLLERKRAHLVKMTVPTDSIVKTFNVIKNV